MQNGFFKLINAPGGYGISIIPPKDGGEGVQIGEVVSYLETAGIGFDISALKQLVQSDTDTVYFLERKECPVYDETYQLQVGSDNMSATARFYPPSDTGKRITFDDFFRELNKRNITTGIQMQILQEHFQSQGIYCTDLVVAKGRAPRHGRDASIEYFFNTNVQIQPTMREDGSVDYFNLNVINHCRKGDVLARIVPEDPGDYGMNICGNRIKPREVKRATLKYGNHIELSEDRLSISTMVDGHVVLVEDKVFVSDVYEVENVDVSIGNIEFEGSVQVNGNVSSNFTIRARGNVIISGVVEGACIFAGGNIIIARGMNGMNKGTLQAGGNIVSKFIENATVRAGGYINTESILHSNASAGTEIVLSGKRGFITGGYVQAGNKIVVKTLGATLGASTIIEVGVDPIAKAEYISLQKSITEIVRQIKKVQPVVTNYTEKRAKGVRFSEEQVKYVKEAVATLEAKRAELEEKNDAMRQAQEALSNKKNAEVIVQGVVYPGVTIIIGDASMLVQSSYKYCKFEKRDGDVKMAPI